MFNAVKLPAVEWQGWDTLFQRIDISFSILIASVFYLAVAVWPTFLHGNLMIQAFNLRIRGELPWTTDFPQFLLHTVTTLFAITVMVVAPVILLFG